MKADELLSRTRVEFDANDPRAFARRRVMVTGAAGTIGSEICRQLVASGVQQLVAVDINENGLYLLERRSNAGGQPHVVAQVADIRDRRRLRDLLRRFTPHDIFHCAAHKHVPLMEAAPCEAVKNNVVATRHLLELADQIGVERFVFVSTDKAVSPTSVMGATKRIGELMTRAVADRSSMQGCAVRFGNVLGSDGSVVPVFRQQIAAGGPVTVTHPDVTRYFMTTSEAVGLVLRAARESLGPLCVLDMGEPVRILDLARRMIVEAGFIPDVTMPIVVIGLRPGEKLDEQLLTEQEERTRRADGPIQVVTSPPPPSDLWPVVERLERAALSEDADAVRHLLRVLLPTYAPAEDPGLPDAASF